MSEFEARTEALRQALLAGKENEKAEATIARAEAFLGFLNPLSGGKRPAAKTVAAKAPAAPRKRGRPRKA